MRGALGRAAVFADERGHVEQEDRAAVEQRIEHPDVFPDRPVALGVRQHGAQAAQRRSKKRSATRAESASVGKLDENRFAAG